MTPLFSPTGFFPQKSLLISTSKRLLLSGATYVLRTHFLSSVPSPHEASTGIGPVYKRRRREVSYSGLRGL